MDRVVLDKTTSASDDSEVVKRALSELLGTSGLAVNYYRLPPGERLPGGLHTHMDQEEVFVVLTGEATFECLVPAETRTKLTVPAGEAIRFAPGEFQSGYNDGDGDCRLLALGAPRATDDVRIPVACDDCGHGGLRLDTDGDLSFVCPDCSRERRSPARNAGTRGWKPRLTGQRWSSSVGAVGRPSTGHPFGSDGPVAGRDANPDPKRLDSYTPGQFVDHNERTRAQSGGDRAMSDSTDEVRAYTVRLELVDEPGELLRALAPIADNGGNLLSIFHERGNVTPRGHIPVEVDLEATPERFDDIVEALRDAGINVIQAGSRRYGESLTVVLTGHVVDTDLSDTLSRLHGSTQATVTDLSLSAPEGTDDVSSARLRLATEENERRATLDAVRDIAAEKDLRVIEPLTGGDG